MPETTIKLFQQIKTGDKIAFDKLFHLFYENLVQQAYNTTQQQADAEDIVQSVFIHLWTKRTQITIEQSVEAYLHRMVQYRCIDYFRKVKSDASNQEKHTQQSLHLTMGSPEEELLNAENLEAIYNKIEALPPKCKVVFKMSRFEEMNYSEIAQELDITKKTVEYHISTALRILRKGIFSMPLLFIQ